MRQHPVLIVGAGPTGLTAAIELSRLGVPVRIVDKASKPSTTSRALAIQARTLELLYQRGLTEEMLRIGNRGNFVQIHNERKQMGSVELSRIPSRFNFALLIPQNETERLMREHLSNAGIEVERSTSLIGFSQPESASHAESDGGLTAILRRADGKLEELEAAYLICAEGSHSSIRHTLNLEFAGKSLPQSYALADLHIDGEVAEDAISIFVVEHGFLGLFPMGGHRFRMIAADPQHASANGADPTLTEMQKLYDAECHIPGVLRDLMWASHFRINSRMLSTLRSQRIFFGGDSAHVHSPAGGQGMNTGIQDMINLGWKLAWVYHGRAASDLLETYTEERLPVIRRLLNTTEKATDAMSSQGHLAHELTTHIAPFMLGFDKVREMAAKTLSQTQIEYRSSSLSHTMPQVGGELRAGDRVPDIEVVCDGAGPTAVPLYSVLDPSRFTVLVGAGADPEFMATVESSHVKVVHVRQSATELLTDENSLLVVRPDAYLGFVGGDHTALNAWFERYFPTS
jgi:2-polyprenyl-6-methoxyphenol hydroxylase-like FAD-dependent oxidoreductase